MTPVCRCFRTWTDGYYTYVHEAADLDMAKEVSLNAKMRRPGICGATETLLVDRSCAMKRIWRLWSAIWLKLAAPYAAMRLLKRRITASPRPRTRTGTRNIWTGIISVKLIDGIGEAVDHIARHGSGHTEAIITDDTEAAEQFLNTVDSAIVMHATARPNSLMAVSLAWGPRSGLRRVGFTPVDLSAWNS